jgi:hypothetical protein
VAALECSHLGTRSVWVAGLVVALRLRLDLVVVVLLEREDQDSL